MNTLPTCFSRKYVALALCLFLTLAPLPPTQAQDTVTGAFEGRITDSQTKNAIGNALIRFINRDTQVPVPTRSKNDGYFYKGLLQPGSYIIEVIADNYQPYSMEQQLIATKKNDVKPLPIELTPAVVAKAVSPTSTTPEGATPPPPPPPPLRESIDILAEITSSDGRRGGVFTEKEVTTLPLGGSSLTRSFDELALLLPGVVLPPQTTGGVAGPGVGPGVGSAGQFSVNGLRSRANNFTVDGSDNNDEDIGVRRQGFFTLVPQSIESVREYQITTLLAPAQFGRNLAAQVNAISKPGTEKIHGTLYGFLNTSHLNARDFFDTASGDSTTNLLAGNQAVILPNGTPIQTRLNTGGKDSLTLAQSGLTFGGPFPRFGEGPPNAVKNTFYFVSAEGQVLNANKEANFAVPTVEQRGAFRSGATGIFNNPIPLPGQGRSVAAYPTSEGGDAVFSLFPFPNNPRGVFGVNTFTQVLPVSAQGEIVSGKVDTNFNAWARQHSFAVRYNFTNDERNIPVTGDALFSGVRARVRTQNISTFLNSDLTAANSTKPFFNQLRVSYGRTRLGFDEGRDVRCRSSNVSFGVEAGCLLPISDLSDIDESLGSLRNEPFLLNRPYLLNLTIPEFLGEPYTGDVVYARGLNRFATTTDQYLGPIGQLVVAGFSPVGADVFNFPQRRVNNTYQVADTVSGKILSHSVAFGLDIRRSELNSELPRNSRPLITYYGAPRLIGTAFNNNFPVAYRYPKVGTGGDPLPFLRPEDFVAANAPSGSFISLANQTDSVIHLRYYQFNFFGQDEWRLRPNLSLSYGLRYEYNTVPEEADRRIEGTFNNRLIDQALPGLRSFIAGRTKIFDADRNNFAPRLSFSYSPAWFGPERTTVIRGGYGLSYDQILGAVVSQSRNVFPNFLTVNFGGGPFPFTFLCIDPDGNDADCGQPGATVYRGGYELFNPLFTLVGLGPDSSSIFLTIPRAGIPNTLNPDITPGDLVSYVNGYFPNAFGATLPARKLPTPMAHQYQISFEQQLRHNLVLAASYVGTQGRNLLRFTTPNLGQNYVLAPVGFAAPESNAQADFLGSYNPRFFGLTLPAGSIINPDGKLITDRRPVKGVGAINQFETTAESRYDALQVQLRGRYQTSLQYQVSYTFSKAVDDVSDVFDLAGASALPQNSLRINERGLANFDTRHRLSYSLSYRLPDLRNANSAFRFFFGQLEMASTGQFQGGQPFTVNSLFDVNLDGNLTDRLNSTAGIFRTVNNRQLLSLTVDPTSLLAAPGQDGAVGRNTFRAAGFMVVNLSLIKTFLIPVGQNLEAHKLTFRVDAFNLTNRANYGTPVRFLEAPSFGSATDTVTPGRRIQFALKYSF